MESTMVAAPRFEAGDHICADLYAWEQLGDGRRTECWLAWSERRWSHVVVKLPRAEHALNPRAARGLAREAQTLRRLAHPAIQRLLEDAHAEAPPHLVLEYVEGPTLDMLVEEEGPLAAGDVVRIGMQLAACLHHVHGEGLAHLDVTPGNVALRDGRAALLDFDIARDIGTPGPPDRPHGTPAYMAPEQCLREPCHPAMDLFALGGVLYEVATGRPAFDMAAVSEESEDAFPQLAHAPVRARAVRPSLPVAADDAIHALLERDPARRPQTALEALRLLAGALPAGEEPLWPDFVDGLLAGRPR
ncbi:MAG TPA: serine/threonine-protein kinase [Candidatus Dormibacteraeota bacterium]|nr:serine/threonine-protein kinase [Candidatus Dormibacteraeota bacterium]